MEIKTAQAWWMLITRFADTCNFILSLNTRFEPRLTPHTSIDALSNCIKKRASCSKQILPLLIHPVSLHPTSQSARPEEARHHRAFMEVLRHVFPSIKYPTLKSFHRPLWISVSGFSCHSGNLHRDSSYHQSWGHPSPIRTHLDRYPHHTSQTSSAL